MATRKVKTDVSEEVKVVEEKKAPKKYDKEDLIPCRSITNGRLVVEGSRSNTVYRWADYGDVEELEYQDLEYLVRAKKPCVVRPRFIIEDEEFVAQHKGLTELYNSLYSMSDFKDILDLSTSRMISEIKKFPTGCQDAIKGLTATMIDDGSLDSVQKIKALDEYFGTNLLLTLVQK